MLNKILRDKLKNKRWVMTSLIILVVIVVLMAFLLIFNSNNKKPISSNTIKVPANLLPSQQSQYLADKGYYDQSVSVLEKQLPSSSNVQDKAQTYYLLTALAFQFHNKSDARKFANQAEQIDPHSNTADSALAIYFQLINNKSEAITYWQQAIKDSNSNSPQYKLLVNQYNASIDALKAQK